MPDAWTEMMTDLLNGIEHHLCRSASRHAKKRLSDLRAKVLKSRSRASHRAVEQEIECSLESKPFYRAAFRRHINRQFTKEVIPQLERLVQLAEEYVQRKQGGR